MYIGINANDVRIISSPSGDAVVGSSNTFVYPILSNVTLRCVANPPPPQSSHVRWNTLVCYTNYNYTNWNPASCFPNRITGFAVNIDDARAEHAVTITCTVTRSGMKLTSDPFTLQISGAVLNTYVHYYNLILYP